MLPQPKRNVWLWVIVVVVAILVLLFAVYYYYYGYVLPEETVGGAGADDVESLEQDLQATAVEGLDVELSDIDKELAQ